MIEVSASVENKSSEDFFEVVPDLLFSLLKARIESKVSIKDAIY